MNKPGTKERFYYDQEFLSSPEARSIRILSEYLGPRQRFGSNRVEDTIVFFGSARIKSREEAEQALANAPRDLSPEQKKRLEHDVEMSHYYEASRELAHRLTVWSKKLKNSKHRYIITSGGGPGIMEAANRGSSEAKGLAIGLNITLPYEQAGNQWITPDLNLQFHYFFMRKFWMAYLAKALVAFPGGFGTLDELMEILTLLQTGKIKKRIPIVLFGSEYWNQVINWDYLVKIGTIDKEDMDLFKICDDVREAFNYITKEITKAKFKGPNF
ncbi:MAG: TIGR00730 family Rossman fold protein [FCB group bacterium]|nr:TIGR00730 family Rossman fold protein [FCB group bacterium]